MILSKEDKTKLYEEYLSQRAKILRVNTSKAIKLVFNKTWDYKAGLTSVTFKSITRPVTDYTGVIMEEVNLRPVANFRYYQITIYK